MAAAMQLSEAMDVDVPHNAPVPFSQKWEMHKPLLEKLYLDEKLQLPKIKEIMHDDHNFDAEIHQYRYQIKKWEWKKSISSAKKERILGIARRRAVAGQATAATYKGRPIDANKLIRFAKTKDAQNGLFAWNNIGRPLSASNTISGGRLCWFNPSDVSYTSPPAIEGPASGLVRAAAMTTAEQNAQLFNTGNFDGLLRALNGREKRLFSTWMYEFWYVSFISAKYWGRGRRHWIASELWRDTQPVSTSGLLAPTPPSDAHSPAPSPTFQRDPMIEIIPPSSLCRWSGHFSTEILGRIEWLSSDPQSHSDDTSQAWPEQWLEDPFQRTLQEGLESNSFSTIDSALLPVDLPHISKVALKSQDQIWKESFGFAIMSRNIELLDRMRHDQNEANENRYLHVQDIYPLHLATTYLDGSKSCCKIFRLLLNACRVRPTEKNLDGFNVFDTLMMTILGNHSKTPPEALSNSLKGTRSFPGQEVDICGRGTPTPRLIEVSSLMVTPKSRSRGNTSSAIYQYWHDSPPELSGLFLDHCSGDELELSSLHTLLLTAFQLFMHGADDEDLFGMICCLLTIVTSPSPLKGFSRVEVSNILSDDGSMEDDSGHEFLSAAELAHRLNTFAQDYVCPEMRKRGWYAFVLVLNQIEDQYRWAQTRRPPPGYEQEHWDIIGEHDYPDAGSPHGSTSDEVEITKRTHEEMPRIKSSAKSKDGTNGFCVPDIIKGADHVLVCKERPYFLSWEVINKRGWTFQERLLSPRILLFGGRFVWQCHTSQDSAGGVNYWNDDVLNLDHRMLGRALFNGGKIDPDNTSTDVDSPDTEISYTLCYKVVEEYSRRDFSNLNDKLPAISALAQVFQDLTGDRYLAGIWHGDILRGLMWSTPPTLNLSRPSSWRAPTWSWASHDNEVSYAGLPSSDSTPVASILATGTVPLSSIAALGEITAATLEIDAPVLEGFPKDATISLMQKENQVPGVKDTPDWRYRFMMETSSKNFKIDPGCRDWKPPDDHIFLVLFATPVTADSAAQ
ncbi:hypothetical protein K402DRAFT_399756 [Aulographum hederae CBS 113979]|uniref:Clr5 domain-containing protein n=1 Tax=Aulographum hederae CBS 113979 TaxID=1176131 RepID=A0A6G1HEX6_9PEZI|nr:hypothetical protein K402DRAFT_399756 [Aulographum hederae CBS 113979]